MLAPDPIHDAPTIAARVARNSGSAGADFIDALIRLGALPISAADRARRVAEESSEPIERVLTNLGLLTERDLAGAIAEIMDVRVAGPEDFPDAPVLEEVFSAAFLSEASVIPIDADATRIRIACVNPFGGFAADAVQFATGKPVEIVVVPKTEFDLAFDRLYDDGKSEVQEITPESRAEAAAEDLDRLKDLASEAPIVRLVNHLIMRAVEARASDIHIEPMDGELRVRYRIDGDLREIETAPADLAAALISRIKILAKLNIAERRLAQDGRIRLAVRGQDIDFRVSTAPTIHGESVVLRILDRGSLNLDFAELGFEADLAAQLRRLLDRPHGILLVTGPTGSGKTTTLYTALLELNRTERKLLTIEDPIEYQLKGVNQVQVKPQIGLTFASALRSFLRQDPDIMMIGEIRDLETAEIAVQAALTGHLILSTLHTNDVASAITRLLDMGIDDYLLPSTIIGVVGQRLIRTLCASCKSIYQAPDAIAERFSLAAGGPVMLYRAQGCPECGHTGYRGRTSIVEVLEMTEDLHELVMRHAPASQLQAAAVTGGMRTMLQHGLVKALKGLTTIEEVLRATQATP